MRHRLRDIKLGRSTAHREALIAGLVCNLIEQKRIRTTPAKARCARSLAEKMVTLARKGTLAARRQAISTLRRKDHVSMLFDEIVPLCEGRQGGYTRIVKLGQRRGDGAEIVLLEWTNLPQAAATKAKKRKAAEAEVDN
jgi:large subunit ribosomal protein L17